LSRSLYVDWGEVIGLQWSDIDLVSHRIVIRSVYVRATKSVREYPKGRKQHGYTIPEELADVIEHLNECLKSPISGTRSNTTPLAGTHPTHLAVLKK